MQKQGRRYDCIFCTENNKCNHLDMRVNRIFAPPCILCIKFVAECTERIPLKVVPKYKRGRIR